MNNALPYKTKQFFFVLIKLSIVVGAFYFIYQKLTQNAELNFGDFIRFLDKNKAFSIKNVLILLFLSIFNWFFEILKWKVLVNSIKRISFKESFEQSLGSLTASLFTPNRIGEYGAKAVYYSTSYRKRIMLLNLIGNMMQMSMTLILGCMGLIFFLSYYQVHVNYNKLGRFLLIILIILTLVGFGASQKKFSIKGFPLDRIKHFVVNLSQRVKVIGFVLSLLRYFIFSFQFYFLLHLFEVNLNYFDSMIVITSMYLLSSIIPSIFIFDVVIKGSIAVFLFSYLGVSSIVILATVTFMWLLNFAIPSIFGSYYVLNFNFPKGD